MSVLAFKPEIWSRVILAAEKKALVFGGPGIVNDDYEGEISGPGTTVHITQFGDPIISDYAPNETISYQELDDAGQELLIDQRKYFGFTIDDVDKRQAAGDMQSYLEDRAAYKLADTADTFIAGLYTGAAYANILETTTNAVVATGSGSSSLTTGNCVSVSVYGGSSTNPADFYLKVVLPLKVKLDEAYVPQQGRYIVIPPWAMAMLEQTQAFVAVATPAQQEVFANGHVGRVAGFDVYVSNNSVECDTTNNGWVIQAGHPMAITFAEQIVQTEALRLQTTFADAVRGLHVYGAKLVRPDHIAVAGVLRPATI